jgi:hypothetical protein
VKEITDEKVKLDVGELEELFEKKDTKKLELEVASLFFSFFFIPLFVCLLVCLFVFVHSRGDRRKREEGAASAGRETDRESGDHAVAGCDVGVVFVVAIVWLFYLLICLFVII